MIEIEGGLAIPDDEVRYVFSRSGGPGGQNVNKVATRVTLLFDVAGSPSLTPEQKARVAARLATRVSRAGVLRVVCQTTRSQTANRDAAVLRFAQLLRAALRRPKPRAKARVSAADKARRLEEKRRRSRVKRDRAARGEE
ncbi:MAG: aminoacyl-tRNA hydrolase [Acidobacteriia bacterium]|nr:aminoacyl-tRNA hydrolase [Terriglobia bacterium]